MIINEFIFIMLGVAIGWLASHLTRKARLITNTPYPKHIGAKNSHKRVTFLSTVLDDHLLKDVYILVDNLCTFFKRHRNARLVFNILFFITWSRTTIESGIIQLKTEYPQLFVPSSDTVLRTLHSSSPDAVEEAILSTMRQIFTLLERHKTKKIIVEIKHAWLAVDITSIQYYGKMGSKKRKYSYKRAIDFVSRSETYIHNTKNGKALKYLTVALASGPLSGFLVYAKPLKVGYDTAKEISKALSFLSEFLDVELVPMDRGFYSGEVYNVLRRYNIKFLTPAVKSKGIKDALFEALEIERISEDIEILKKKIGALLDHKFRGRGAKGATNFKISLGRYKETVQNANSVSEIVGWLENFQDLEPIVPVSLRKMYEEILKLADSIVERITEPPRFIVQVYELQGKKREHVILSMQLNEEQFLLNLTGKFRSEASRSGKGGAADIDLREVLKRLFLDSYYFFASSDFGRIPVDEQGEVYRRRWVVETAHKMFHEVLMRTTSNDISVRNMEVLIAIIMYDLWVMHREDVGHEDEHVYNVTLREFKMNYTRDGFLMFEYTEGQIAFIRYGEIVDIEWFSRDVAAIRSARLGGGEINSCTVERGGEPPPPIGTRIYVVMAVGDCGNGSM